MTSLTAPPLNFPIDEINFRISHINESSSSIIAYSKELQRKLSFKDTLSDFEEKKLLDDADKYFEEYLISLISRKFSNDSFNCENTGIIFGKNDYKWVIDAIDGSMNFLRGLPLFAISLGIFFRETSVASIVIIPDSNDFYYAVLDNGSYRNKIQIKVSTIKSIDRSLLISSFPSSRNSNMREIISEISAFVSTARSIRRSGSFVLDMCWLAEGKIDGLWDKEIGTFDAAASALLVTEAGGSISDYIGGQIISYPVNLIASNGFIHSQIIDVLYKTRKELSLN